MPPVCAGKETSQSKDSTALGGGEESAGVTKIKGASGSRAPLPSYHRSGSVDSSKHFPVGSVYAGRLLFSIANSAAVDIVQLRCTGLKVTETPKCCKPVKKV